MLAGRFRAALLKFFERQAIHAVAVFLDRVNKAALQIQYKNLNPNDIIPAGDNQRLLGTSRPYFLQMIISASATAAELVGTQALTESSPQMVALLRTAGQRIVRINDVTREAVQRTLNEGLSRGLSDFQVARGVTEIRDSTGRVTREAFTGLRSVVEET
jgi:hypothetical protein